MIKARYFSSNSLTGTVNVAQGQIIFNQTVEPIDFEGNVDFNVAFRRGSFNSKPLYISDTITLIDTAQLTGITANTLTINEGDLVTFSVTTSGVESSNLKLYYSTAGNIVYNDFVGGNVGSFYLVNGSGSITLQLDEDLSTVIESDEQFQLQIRKDSTTGTVLGTSSNVIIVKDTSNSVGVTSTTISSNVLFETESTTITIDAVNALGNAGGTLYYTITGNADIYTGQSGSVVVNDNTANLELITEASVLGGQTREFAVQFRKDSTSGDILYTTDPVYVRDAIISIEATGGSKTTSGEYTTHSYNTSSSLNITRAGEANVLVVGGGGGGGSSNPTGWQTGGGGAGGVVYATNYTLPTGSYTITIGSGGAGDNNGSNTTLSSPSVYLIGLGGGRGGNGGFGGYPGGSGGGGAHNNGGFGLALQANFSGDSGVYGYGNPGAGGGNGFGGGGGGASGVGVSNGPGGNGLPVVMLTEGLTTYYGGGGGGSGTAGGLGGGGTGPGPAGSGVVNSGGGGGSSGYGPGNPGGPGGSGVVLIKYRTGSVFTPKISYITEVTPNVNILKDTSFGIAVSTVNAANNETFYWYTTGELNNNVFLEGNTGSFAVYSNTAVIPLTANSNYLTSNITGTFNIRRRANATYSLFSRFLSVNVNPVPYITASGGTELTEGGYKYHVFTSTANLIVSAISTEGDDRNTIDYLVVAGGGGGGKAHGAGGGAGGLLSANLILSPSNVGETVVTVGGGGSGASGGNQPNTGRPGSRGSNSIISLFGLNSFGGGAGMGEWSPGNAPQLHYDQRAPGGSGGGASVPVSENGGVSAGGQGNPGGANTPPGGGGAGGGGAGVAGTPKPSTDVGGAGGNGIPVDWIPASYGTTGPAPGRWFAGGGGGSGSSNPTSGVGGAGGGGNGGRGEAPWPPGTAGTTNTGGGGGGGHAGFTVGMAGGSGIVIIRYPIG